MKTLPFLSVICVAFAMTHANGQERAALPPSNPYLIQNNSVYPSVHFDPAQTDTTSLPVWQGETKIELRQGRLSKRLQ